MVNVFILVQILVSKIVPTSLTHAISAIYVRMDMAWKITLVFYALSLIVIVKVVYEMMYKNVQNVNKDFILKLRILDVLNVPKIVSNVIQMQMIM